MTATTSTSTSTEHEPCKDGQHIITNNNVIIIFIAAVAITTNNNTTDTRQEQQPTFHPAVPGKTTTTDGASILSPGFTTLPFGLITVRSRGTNGLGPGNFSDGITGGSHHVLACDDKFSNCTRRDIPAIRRGLIGAKCFCGGGGMFCRLPTFTTVGDCIPSQNGAPLPPF